MGAIIRSFHCLVDLACHKEHLYYLKNDCQDSTGDQAIIFPSLDEAVPHWCKSRECKFSQYLWSKVRLSIIWSMRRTERNWNQLGSFWMLVCTLQFIFSCRNGVIVFLAWVFEGNFRPGECAPFTQTFYYPIWLWSDLIWVFFVPCKRP
jgi:hypothetical protein